MNENKKYPKSIDGNQCISPCFPVGFLSSHPITLSAITNKEYPYCHIQPIIVDAKLNKKVEYNICAKPSSNEEIKNYNTKLIIPISDMDSGIFLRSFYNIHTFEDGINWIINNDNKPIMTRLRIFDNIFVYGKDIDIIDIRIITFIIEVIKKLWIKDIYKELYKYISINKKNEIFIEKNDDDINENINNKINFIIKKFVNNDEVYKFMSRYIKARYENWNKISSHIINIKNDYIDYIENKIKLTISNYKEV